MDISGMAENHIETLLNKYAVRSGARLGELRWARDMAAKAIDAIDSDCHDYAIDLLKKILQRVHELDVEDTKELKSVYDQAQASLAL